MGANAAKIVFIVLVAASFLFVAWVASSQSEKAKPVLFFAYGANADPATMAARAGGFESVQMARLADYRLAFQTGKSTEFGVASILPEAGAGVAGALYTLTQGQMAALDENSDVPNFYRKRDVKVLASDGKLYGAASYFLSGNAEFAVPSRPYLNATLSGLRRLGFGQEELDAVAAAAEEAAQKAGK